jgi:TPP-dependent trihydroxycyclohexane-1,2-dione (THcHDO) dehydratase
MLIVTMMLTGTYQMHTEVSQRLLRALPSLLVVPDEVWDCPLVRVDFALHAQSLGCAVVDVPAGATVDDLRAGYARARELAVAERRPAVLVCRTHPSSWTESGAWWEVGVPASLSGHSAYQEGKTRQLRWTR